MNSCHPLKNTSGFWINLWFLFKGQLRIENKNQKSPLEAVVPSQRGHPGWPEQLARELPAAPEGDGRVGGDAGAGSGAAALGHAGGCDVRVGARGRGVRECACACVHVGVRLWVRTCVQVCRCVLVSVHICRCACVSVRRYECECGFMHTHQLSAPVPWLLTVKQYREQIIHSVSIFFFFNWEKRYTYL